MILDCDPGHDDVVALLLALASEEVELLGVTTVAGNQSVERTTDNALRVLEHLGLRGLPVAAGAPRPLLRELVVATDAHGETGLGGVELPAASREAEPMHAIDWMAQAIGSREQPVSVVATGPLTNVALLLIRYPELEARIDGIVMMGGAIGEGNITPGAEFNVWTDPEAAHRVMGASVPVTMVGLDVTQRALITRAHLEQLAGSGKAGRLISDSYGYYIDYYGRRYGWEGAPAHDAMAMAHAIDDTLLSTPLAGVLVDTGGEPGRGRTWVDRSAQLGWPAVHVATEVDGERFLELVLGRIARLDRR